MKDCDQSIDTFIIYFHSHGSNRQEGHFLLEHAGQLNFNLCLLDMRGSGDSKGQFSTLGVKEYRDVHSMVKLLQKKFRAKNILLYGRSMGAASVMKFISEYRNGRSNPRQEHAQSGRGYSGLALLDHQALLQKLLKEQVTRG